MLEIQDYYVEPADWTMDREALEAVRVEVFIVEQSVPEDEEFDDDDPVSDHFLARSNDGQPVGTARLTPDGRIGRMAVIRDWRGKGVGEALLRSAVERAQLKAMPELTLAAQTHALDFYRRQGFEPYGDEFDDVGIPHIWMRRKLEPAAVGAIERDQRQPEVIDSTEPQRFSSCDQYREHVLSLIGACRQRLLVFTRDLEPRVLGEESVIQALRKLATRSPQVDIRVMVVDPTRAIKDGHLLVNLSQRLSSLIHIRRPGKQHEDLTAGYAIADGTHTLHREFSERWEGVFRPNDRRFALTLACAFQEAWEQGYRDPHLTRLDL